MSRSECRKRLAIQCKTQKVCPFLRLIGCVASSPDLIGGRWLPASVGIMVMLSGTAFGLSVSCFWFSSDSSRNFQHYWILYKNFYFFFFLYDRASFMTEEFSNPSPSTETLLLASKVPPTFQVWIVTQPPWPQYLQQPVFQQSVIWKMKMWAIYLFSLAAMALVPDMLNRSWRR